MNSQDQQWHWAEGNKYALECMKAMLLLNGGGALALLTFVGNRTRAFAASAADAVGISLLSFGVGTLGSVAVFMLAYFTQLNYGNDGVGENSHKAAMCHNLTYLAVLVALSGFCAGIWFARHVVVALIT